MNTELFTIEEENLICIFDTSGRDALISSIRDAMPHFDEPGMDEIAESVLKKLDAMTGAEFSALTFNPVYDNDDDETEV